MSTGSKPVVFDWVFVHRDGCPFSCETVTEAIKMPEPGIRKVSEEIHLYLKGYVIHPEIKDIAGGLNRDEFAPFYERIIGFRKEKGSGYLVAITDCYGEVMIRPVGMRKVSEINSLRAQFKDKAHHHQLKLVKPEQRRVC